MKLIKNYLRNTFFLEELLWPARIVQLGEFSYQIIEMTHALVIILRPSKDFLIKEN